VLLDAVLDQLAECLGHQLLEHLPHLPLAGRDDLAVGRLFDRQDRFVQPLLEPLGHPPLQDFLVHGSPR